MDDTQMDPKKWRRRFVYCREAYLAVYQYYCGGEDDSSPSGKETVLLIAGCANTVAVYTMLEDRSLPDYLFKNGTVD